MSETVPEKPEPERPEFLQSFLDGKTEDTAATTPPQETADDASPQKHTVIVNVDDRDPDLEFRIIEMLRTIFDPEIPVNIYELGLIYGLTADKSGNVKVVMTLTTPHCPVAESMPGDVETKVRAVDGVRDVEVEITWDPPWDQTMMSEVARLELGFM